MINSVLYMFLRHGNRVYSNWEETNRFQHAAAVRRADKAGIPIGPERTRFCDHLYKTIPDELYAEGKAMWKASPIPLFVYVMAGFFWLFIIWIIYLIFFAAPYDPSVVRL